MDGKNEIRLFLDDIRESKDCISYMYKRIGALNPIYLEEWKIVRNYDEFTKELIRCHTEGIKITHVSFDHDLADEHYLYDEGEEYSELYKEKTGYDCAKFLKKMYERQGKELPIMFVHSMNPVGTDNIINLFKQ